MGPMSVIPAVSDGISGLKITADVQPEMLQCHAIKKLHGDEGAAVLLADVVNGADVGMIQGRRGLRLTPEASQRLGVFGDIIRKKLQGDEAALYTTPIPAPPSFSRIL